MESIKEPNSIIVVGRNSQTNLSVIRALGIAGYRVRLLHVYDTSRVKSVGRFVFYPRCDVFSKYLFDHKYCVTNGNEDVIVEKLLSMKADNRQLIIPTDDQAASVIDRNLNRLSLHFYVPSAGAKEGALDQWMSKSLQKEKACEAGLPVAPGTFLDFRNGAWSIPDDLKYPCFLKPDKSRCLPKAVMKRCETREELDAALKRFESARCALAEQMVEVDHEFSILGVCLGDDVSMPCMFHTLSSGSTAGVASSGITADPKTLGAVMEPLRSFLRSLNFTGVFDADFLIDKNGKMYFSELNLRCGASLHAFTVCGVNLPGQLADCIFNKDFRTEATCAAGKTFVSESVCLENYIQGTLDDSQMRSIIKECDIPFVYDPKDMAPYRHFLRYTANAKVLRTIKKFCK